MLSEVAEFVYTRLFRPKPLRTLVNGIIKRLLPRQVRYGNAVICLNPADPVISGALALRVYERKETRFINEYLKPDDLFIDIGANVGYYTAIAIHRVGDKGRVVALEPDPVSFACLERTVAANAPAAVDAFNMAATDAEGERVLYVSSENRGDNRFHQFAGSTDKVKTRTITVDSLLTQISLPTRLGGIFVKIDVQGSEGLVMRGMKNTIMNAGRVVLLMEFWPQGLRNMGTDPDGLLTELEQLGLDLYELGNSGVPARIADRAALIDRLQGRKYTNIVGLRQ